MPTVNVGAFEDSFVIHFGGDFSRINAYTLATALTNIADAAKAANATLNPGWSIEVVVEAAAPGSFKTKIRTIYRSAENLFSTDNVRAIVLSVIAAFIYQHTLAPSPEITVNVGPSEVVIQQGETRIVIPRGIHDSMQEVERSSRFRTGIGQAMRAIEEDPRVQSFGFSSDLGDPHPDIAIPRERFPSLPSLLDDGDDDSREFTEITDVEILRAILERSKRRWQFVWNGMKIAAPVTDERFYDEFFAHRITIAPGDALRVKLLIRQRRAPDIGVFINESYEVIEVLKHMPRPPQMALTER